MKLDLFNHEATKIWKRISDSEENATALLQLEIDLYKKLLVFFQIGESCYMVFNFQTAAFEFVSESVTEVFGYNREEVSVNHIMQNIHPDDRAWFLNWQEAGAQFLAGLSPERQMKYKLRMDYRIKKQNGEYAWIMNQCIVIHNDSAGNVIRNLLIFTDISHLKSGGRHVISCIGMDGEPSFLDVDISNNFCENNNPLSKREMEVLYLLAEGKPSKEIAELLYISKYTVDTHRKNMLLKTGTENSIELINKAIRDGLI